MKDETTSYLDKSSTAPLKYVIKHASSFGQGVILSICKDAFILFANWHFINSVYYVWSSILNLKNREIVTLTGSFTHKHHSHLIYFPQFFQSIFSTNDLVPEYLSLPKRSKLIYNDLCLSKLNSGKKDLQAFRW